LFFSILLLLTTHRSTKPPEANIATYAHPPSQYSAKPALDFFALKIDTWSGNNKSCHIATAYRFKADLSKGVTAIACLGLLDS
jgi:hypothetical protein